MKKSLRRQLFFALAMPLAVLWLIASAGILWVIDHEVTEVFDSSLQETAQRLLPLAVAEIGQHHDPGSAAWHTIPNASGHKEYLVYQIRDANGSVVLRSHNASQEPIAPALTTGFKTSNNVRIYTEATPDKRYFIHVAEPATHRGDTLYGILKFLIIPLAGVIPVAVLAILWAIRSAQGPINRYGNAIGEVTGANLHAIDLAKLPTELQTIGRSVNHLISRLKTAIEAERLFAENTAHELRTPLAVALAQLQLIDIDTLAPGNAERIVKTRSTLLRLEKLVTKLLQLAKAESGVAMNFRQVDLCRITQFITTEAQSSSAGHEFRLRQPDHPVVVNVDIDALGIVLLNLLENANQYATPGTPIDIVVSDDKSIDIYNECAPLAPASLHTIAARYQRGSTSGSGLGIGLAIVESIVRQSNGNLEIHSPIAGTNTGFHVRIMLA